MTQFFSSVLELMRLQSEMNKIFEALEAIESDEEFSDINSSPLYDIFETPEKIIIEMDLPGVDSSTLKVVALANTIVVEGERKHSKKKVCHYLLIERQTGPFKKKLVAEGSFNTHKGVATFKNGVLRVEFPKVVDRRGTPCEIKVIT